MYAGTTRTCVFNMCAWCRHTRGPFECVPDGGGRGEGRGVVVSLVFFIGKTSVFWKFHEHINRTLGSSLIDSSAYQNFPHWVITCFRGSPEATPWILPISSLRIPRTKTPVHQHTTPHHTTPPNHTTNHPTAYTHMFWYMYFGTCMCA